MLFGSSKGYVWSDLGRTGTKRLVGYWRSRPLSLSPKYPAPTGRSDRTPFRSCRDLRQIDPELADGLPFTGSTGIHPRRRIHKDFDLPRSLNPHQHDDLILAELERCNG